MLVTVFVMALVVGFPAKAVSLFLTLIQAVAAIMSLVDFEEGISMANSMLVVSGTHGVVRILVG